MTFFYDHKETNPASQAAPLPNYQGQTMKQFAALAILLTLTGAAQFAAIQTAAPSLGVELTPVNVRDAGGIERDLSAFAHSPDRGLIGPEAPTVKREAKEDW